MTKARDLASGGFGLVLVKPSSVVNGTDNGKGTVNFSGVSSISLNNVFSSTYNNYQIVVDLTGSTLDQTTYVKLRSSATDSSASYSWGYPGILETGTASNENGANQSTGWWILTNDGGANGHYASTTFNLYRPFLAVPTTMTYNSGTLSYASTFRGNAGGGAHFVSTSYDGFTVVASAGTIAGSISVYGFNN